MNSEHQSFKRWLVSILEDLWSSLWRSLLSIPLVMLGVFFTSSTTRGLGAGYGIMAEIALVVVILWMVVLLYFRFQSRQGKKRGFWQTLGLSLFDSIVAAVFVFSVPMVLPLISLMVY